MLKQLNKVFADAGWEPGAISKSNGYVGCDWICSIHHHNKGPTCAEVLRAAGYHITAWEPQPIADQIQFSVVLT